MRRFKEFFKTKIINRIRTIFKKPKGFENTAKHSLEKLTSLVKKRSSNGKGLTNFQWDQIFSTVFSPRSRKKIHNAFIASLVASLTYGAGKTIALIASSQDVSSRTSTNTSRSFNQQKGNQFAKDIAEIKRANLFNARESDDDKIEKLTKKKVTLGNNLCKSSQGKSSLPIKLVNTVVLQDSVKSIASIQIRSANELVTVRQGDNIKQMAKVGLINRRQVILQNLSSGACEHIENLEEKVRELEILSPSRGRQLMQTVKSEGISQEGNSFKIKKSFRDKMLSDISKILSDARAIPIENPDGTIYFKMTEIKPGSIYTMLNIEEGDIVKGYDGRKIRNVNEMMSLFGKIRDIDHIRINVNHQGTDEEREFNFVD